MPQNKSINLYLLAITHFRKHNETYQKRKYAIEAPTSCIKIHTRWAAYLLKYTFSNTNKKQQIFSPGTDKTNNHQ